MSLTFSEYLDGHDAIAWDFDQTLNGHPLSTLMHDYIRKNPQKRHVIVTFRSGKRNGTSWAGQVWDDLAANYEDPLTSYHFERVINMDEEFFDTHCSKKIGSIFVEAGQAYTEWKGEMCAKHGLTILIDDHPEHTKPGCDKYGIAYLNPHDLL